MQGKDVRKILYCSHVKTTEIIFILCYIYMLKLLK